MQIKRCTNFVLCALLAMLDMLQSKYILLKIAEMLKEFVGSPNCCCCCCHVVAADAAWQIECEQVPQ